MHQIREYKIIEKIGEGGMGEVFLAEDENLGRMVAIKVLAPELLRNAALIERFKQEARLQATLTHPNIVSLYNFFFEANNYYMVLEYVEGVTLKQIIGRSGRIDEQRCKYIFSQILEGLGYAHSQGVMHRDIKPSNIIINEKKHDNVKIMDFGIAKVLGDRGMTKTGTKMGTIYYMSPEQVRAEKDIDQRTDIYSLGIVLYEMLTGKLPFNTNTESDFAIMNEIVGAPLKDLNLYNKNVSENIWSVIKKMTAKAVNDRYRTCYQVGVDIEEKVGEKSASINDQSIVAGDSGHTINKEKLTETNKLPQSDERTTFDKNNQEAHLRNFKQNNNIGQNEAELNNKQIYSNGRNPFSFGKVIAGMVLILVAIFIIFLIVKKDDTSANLGQDEQNENAQNSHSSTSSSFDEQMWQNVKNNSDPEKIQDYLNNYPNTIHRSEAELLINNLNSISSNEIKNFLDDMMIYSNNKNIDGIVNCYADNVNFFKSGIVNKNFIKKDKIAYYKSWDVVNYEIINGSMNIISNANSNSKTVQYRISYTVYSTKRNKQSQGVSENILQIRKGRNGIEIYDQKEKVIPRRL